MSALGPGKGYTRLQKRWSRTFSDDSSKSLAAFSSINEHGNFVLGNWRSFYNDVLIPRVHIEDKYQKKNIFIHIAYCLVHERLGL